MTASASKRANSGSLSNAPRDFSGRGPVAGPTRLGLTAAAALLLGLGIYVLDRDWSTTLFLAPFADAQWQRLGLFGEAGQVLPSFLHAYAIAVLLVLTLRPWPRSRGWLCAGWFAIAAALEFLQANAVTTLVFAQSGTPIDHALFKTLALYALQGHFDIADLCATALGCMTAYVATTTLEKHR